MLSILLLSVTVVNSLSQVYLFNDNLVAVPIDRIVLNNAKVVKITIV